MHLCTSLYALHSMHFTLCTYALHSMHFTLCTSLYALHSFHSTHFTLCTSLYALHSMHFSLCCWVRGLRTEEPFAMLSGKTTSLNCDDPGRLCQGPNPCQPPGVSILFAPEHAGRHVRCPLHWGPRWPVEKKCAKKGYTFVWKPDGVGTGSARGGLRCRDDTAEPAAPKSVARVDFVVSSVHPSEPCGPVE